MSSVLSRMVKLSDLAGAVLIRRIHAFVSVYKKNILPRFVLIMQKVRKTPCGQNCCVSTACRIRKT